MNTKRAIMRIFPEIPEFKEVDFSQYSTPYGALLIAFLDSGKTGLREFEEFVEENGGTKADVGRFLISIFQYLLIRYRRYGDESVEVPAFKIFLTLKGWLNEHGFENDYRRLLHSFVGYLVGIAGRIAERFDCEIGPAYMKTAYLLTIESEETFGGEYFSELKEKAREMLEEVYRKCKIDRTLFEKRKKDC
ncbi:hypothetical protein CL1_1781 [Thermococcus cleftensis]|uniref:Uncharacterized protein n=1 Tax=Thermococcus cleftensis (strain DSM 27260 / KACC 17922 / CL1) TaxID=163003 RepID=I3ZW93_THECF|nr:hypothetical protein [Thermococcus cleftensis]AFL95977.1 hypothetical protein CL1_1781 [Thermococcus cleftensis]